MLNGLNSLHHWVELPFRRREGGVVIGSDMALKTEMRRIYLLQMRETDRLENSDRSK